MPISFLHIFSYWFLLKLRLVTQSYVVVSMRLWNSAHIFTSLDIVSLRRQGYQLHQATNFVSRRRGPTHMPTKKFVSLRQENLSNIDTNQHIVSLRRQLVLCNIENPSLWDDIIPNYFHQANVVSLRRGEVRHICLLKMLSVRDKKMCVTFSLANLSSLWDDNKPYVIG